MDAPHAAGFDEELARFAADLRRLRIERGNPSYRELEARAAKSRIGGRLPVATQSDAFRGKRLPGLDTLMTLVRTLYAYDEDGRPIAVPPHAAPELGPWRLRWRALASLQPTAPDRARRPPSAPEPPAVAQEATGRIPAAAAVGDGNGFALAHRFSTPERHPWGVAFSPDGRILAVGTDGVVQLWDPVRGRALGEIKTRQPGMCMAFSPHGGALAIGRNDGSAQLWDVHTLAPVGPLLEGHEEPVKALAFSPDGRILATASDDETVRRWDTASGKPAGPPLVGHFGEVGALAFFPGSRLLAALKGRRGVQLWDLLAGKAIGKPLTGYLGELIGMAFSPDGQLLATSGDSGTQLWDTATGSALGWLLHGPDALTWGAVFSPDGRMLATACDDGTVRLWDRNRGVPVGPPLTGYERPLHHVAFSPDGRCLAACGEAYEVVVYHHVPDGDARRLESLAVRAVTAALREGHAVALPAMSSYSGIPLRRLAFSPNGERLLVRTADRRILTWYPATRVALPEGLALPDRGPWGLDFPQDREPAELWTQGMPSHDPLRHPVSLHPHLAFTPDGRYVAWIDADGHLRMWDVAEDAAVAIRSPEGVSDVSAVACSPDGRMLAAAGHARTVLWDPMAGGPTALVLEPLGDDIRALAFSPDGRLLATGDADGAIRVWDTATGAPAVGAGFRGHTGQVQDLAFSPDGRVLASASSDGTVQLWNPAVQLPVAELPLTGHTGEVRGIAFSPDGSLLASAGDDGTVRFWMLPGVGGRQARPR